MTQGCQIVWFEEELLLHSVASSLLQKLENILSTGDQVLTLQNIDSTPATKSYKLIKKLHQALENGPELKVIQFVPVLFNCPKLMAFCAP